MVITDQTQTIFQFLIGTSQFYICLAEPLKFICQCDTADTGADPVDRAHEVAGMEQRRHAGTAPRIGATIAGDHGKKHRPFA